MDDPAAASLVTGVSGRWTTNGILRDVRSPSGRIRREDCEYAIRTQGGMVGGGIPMGPRGDADRASAPRGFEFVYENAFGSLWRNTKPPASGDRKPAPPVVPLWGLVLLAGIGFGLLVGDFVLPLAYTRARRYLTVLSVLGATVALSQLGWTAVQELLHPAVAPAPKSGGPLAGPGGPGGPGGLQVPGGPGEPGDFREPPSLGGPAMGFGPPGGPPEGLAGPDIVPESLEPRYRRIHVVIREWLDAGDDPRSFWAPEDEMEFLGLIEEGQVKEAEALLDAAMGKAFGDAKEAKRPEIPENPEEPTEPEKPQVLERPERPKEATEPAPGSTPGSTPGSAPEDVPPPPSSPAEAPSPGSSSSDSATTPLEGGTQT
jgi:hypothetical protein